MNDLPYAKFSFGERARFIKKYGRDCARSFEREATTHEQTVARCHRGGDRGDERHGQAERMRTRNNEHSDQSLSRYGDTCALREPDRKCKCAGAKRDKCQMLRC